MKQVTRVTPEGYVVSVETGGVMGFKCLQCSTAEIADTQTQYDADLLVDYIFTVQAEHKNC